MPQRFVAWLARVLYNEPYRAAPMGVRVDDGPRGLGATYTLDRGGRTHTLHVTGSRPAATPGPESAAYYFKEHSWGFGTTRRGGLVRYEVTHPEWAVYPVTAFRAGLDWGQLYGPGWADMNGREPDSVTFAAGSPVRVYPKGRPASEVG